jgi:hypothetical protein
MIKKEELRLGNWILAVWDDGFDESEMFITGNSVEKGLELENANGEYNFIKWEYISTPYLSMAFKVCRFY